VSHLTLEQRVPFKQEFAWKRMGDYASPYLEFLDKLEKAARKMPQIYGFDPGQTDAFGSAYGLPIHCETGHSRSGESLRRIAFLVPLDPHFRRGPALWPGGGA